jgi:hypothetical protein
MISPVDLGYDEIKAFTENFLSTPAKQPLRPTVPIDYAVMRVDGDEGISRRLGNEMGQSLLILVPHEKLTCLSEGAVDRRVFLA